MSEPTPVAAALPDLDAFWELALKNEEALRKRPLTDRERWEARQGVGLPSDPVIRKLERTTTWPAPDPVEANEAARVVLAGAIQERRFDDGDIRAEVDRLAEEAAAIRQAPDPEDSEALRAMEKILGPMGQVRPSSLLQPSAGGALTPEEILASREPEEADSLDCLGETGFFIRGRAHLLAADQKAGKTDLMFHLCSSWCEAGEIVLWCSEEPLADWQERFADLGSPANFQVIPQGRTPEQYLRAALASSASIIVVDTLRDVVCPEDENHPSLCQRDYGQPWLKALVGRQGKTVITLHHQNKSGGISSSHAIPAMHSMILRLARGNGTLRTLAVEGRTVLPKSLQYRRTATIRFQLVGGADSLADRALDALAQRPEEWLGVREVLEDLGGKEDRNLVRRALLKLAKEGQVGSMEPETPGDLWFFRHKGVSPMSHSG